MRSKRDEKKPVRKRFAVCGQKRVTGHNSWPKIPDPRPPRPSLYRSLSLFSVVDDAETNGFLNALQTAERSQTSVKLSTSFLARFTHTLAHTHAYRARTHTHNGAFNLGP